MILTFSHCFEDLHFYIFVLHLNILKLWTLVVVGDNLHLNGMDHHTAGSHYCCTAQDSLNGDQLTAHFKVYLEKHA